MKAKQHIKKIGKVGNRGIKSNFDLRNLSVDDFMSSTFIGSGDSDNHSDDVVSDDTVSGSDSDAPNENNLSFDGNEVNADPLVEDENVSDVDDEESSGEERTEENSGEDIEDSDDSAEDSDDENVSDVDDEESSGKERTEENSGEDIEDSDDSAEDSDGSNMFDNHTHKKSLEKLRETDPDFYKFLEQNDKNLLQFNASDSEDEDEDEDDEDKVHKPVHDLEVASDESDFETDDKQDDERVVTLKMVRNLQEQLQNTNSFDALRCAVQMFHSALQRVASPEDEEDTEDAKYVVEGSAVFNAVVQLCMLDLQPAVKRCLNLPSSGKKHVQLNKCKKWRKVKPLLKLYLTDLVKFLGSVSSAHILTVLLKHLHQLTIFVPYFRKVRRPLLKRLVKLWGLGEETVRVISFLCILKLTTNQKQELLEQVLKTMYLTYVRNCKFISPTTLPSVHFMRRSLAEMFALDEAASYKHVFLYVRQLAIHLRNAITLHKKESMQAVYNWQFVQSLHLWTEVLGATAHRPHLQPLLYPLVQVIIGTIKLIPSAQYYPLRFHCVQMLIHLSKQTGTFVPVLPFVLEVLNGFNFNKPHKKASMKPLDFTCILRLSKSQLQENGFKDAVIEKVYQQLLEYLTSESHTICFPDIVVPTIIQLKKFIKECKSSSHSRKLKQVLEKIEENARGVETERCKVSFSLSDRKAIDAWETNLKLKGTPLITFFESWNKVNLQLMAKRATNNDELGEYNIPTLKKRKQANPDHVDGPVELFPSSDDSDGDTGLTQSAPPKKKKRGTRGGKGKQKEKVQDVAVESMNNVLEAEDIVQDLRLSDFE